MNSISEGKIQNMLNSKYIGNAKYKVPNIFVFGWESDFFLQKENGYCYEFEIKISRSDFLADFKKQRHINIQKQEKKLKPNKFYYVVPVGMVSKEEVPNYAGLMYVNDFSIITIKEAPFIHKEKLKLEDNLCHKFYHYWVNQKIENRDLRKHIKYQDSIIQELKNSKT
jgi:hypothetical protein